MARRATSAGENGDAPVANGNVQVKAEKIKVKEKARAAKGKQPVVEEQPEEEGEDGDAQGEDDNEQAEVEEQVSPRGSKRMRVNGDGDSVPSGSQHQQQAKRGKTLPRGVDGYIPGSIVRIQLQNFVTYDYVQFRPGPYLNMIIGPNGTGKSSIACAIALGLNFPPSILGRANELNSFVKMGSDQGYIEIELKAPHGKRNLVIRRNLSAVSKGSTFTLNGNSATGNEIKNKMSELNVQVGNLCSFLPQDKVSEFAAMSPQQLLRETQRAAGDERLTQWHDTLISAGKDLKSMSQLIKEEQEQLRQMLERNEGIERDVQRFLERKRIEHDIAILELLIPVERYRVMRKRFMETKARQRKLHKKVKALKDKNAPAHALLKKFEQSHKDHERKREDLKKSTQAKFQKMKNKWQASDKLETEAEELTVRLGAIKKEEKDRKNRIKTVESDISRLTAELQKPSQVKLEKMQDLNDEARQIQTERNQVVSRKEGFDYKIRQLIDRKAKANIDLQNAHSELKKQDDADVRKLRNLERWDRDTHDAIMWLRANKHRFKMEVFEPPLMCVSVKDRRYIDAVEACISMGQMKTFVAQCREDVNTFNHFINDSQTLGRKTRVTTWYRDYQEHLVIAPPMSREELRELGFDGYAMDYIEFPPGMEKFLTMDVNLHRTAIGLNANAVDVNRAMQAVARPLNNHGGGASFINGKTMNIVTRSRYGRKAIGNMTRDVHNARNLANITIDPEVKQRIDATIRVSNEEIALCDEEKKVIDEDMRAILAEDKVFEKRLNSVKARKDAVREEERRIISARSKLERYQKNLVDLQNAPSAEHERGKLRKRLLDITKHRVVIAREYTTLARAVIAEQTEATQVGLKYLQIGANKAALQDLCNRKDEKFQTALAEFNTVDEAFQQIKDESRAVLQHSRDVIAEAQGQVKEDYLKIEETRLTYDQLLTESDQNGGPAPNPEGVDLRTLEELQQELDTQRANLDMNLNTNPGVVEQYEKRKRDIEQLEKTIADRQKKADKVERNIKNARENWQPALEKLVASIGEKFSAAFDRIGCAGEIRISEHEDYEKWAIDILVKFRDSEKLQLLTGQRQSGGERSLTTILYLMSLTEEARAPFSLVDEINQGMDQRAERMVHNSMVEVTCKEESAQYFLITPKLLPDLKYHERMKILCVNNGEWLPEERNLGNMMAMIDGFLAHHSQN